MMLGYSNDPEAAKANNPTSGKRIMCGGKFVQAECHGAALRMQESIGTGIR